MRCGRPRKTAVDPAIAKRICNNLEIGMPLDLAAEVEGVARTTVRDWIRAFSEFSERVTQSRAKGAKKLVLQSLQGGPGAGQAMRLLERLFPEDYGLRSGESEQSEVKITIVGGLPRRD